MEVNMVTLSKIVEELEMVDNVLICKNVLIIYKMFKLKLFIIEKY